MDGIGITLVLSGMVEGVGRSLPGREDHTPSPQRSMVEIRDLCRESGGIHLHRMIPVDGLDRVPERSGERHRVHKECLDLDRDEEFYQI